MKKTNTTVHISGFPIFNDKHELKYAVACDRDIQQLETVKDQLIQLKSAIEKKKMRTVICVPSKFSSPK